MKSLEGLGALAPAKTARKLLVALTAVAIAVAFSVAESRPAHAAAFSFDVNNTTDAHRAAGAARPTCDSTIGPGVCTLRAAIEEANTHPAADTFTITLHTATYALDPTGGFQALLMDGRGITLKGDGAANSIIDHGANPTLYRLLQINSSSNPYSFTGLTFQRGNIDSQGGGININAGATVTMNAVSIANNTAGLDGGGILNFGILTMTNSMVTGNASTTGFGGGICDQCTGILAAAGAKGRRPSSPPGGSVTLSNVVVSNNTVGAGSCGGGVAIFDQGTFTDVTFDSNVVSGNGCGGGLYLNGVLGTVNRVTFRNNQAAGVNGEGGGLDVDSSPVGCGGPTLPCNTVVNSTFNGNTASFGSAVAVDGLVSILNATVAGNTAGANGGAINSFGSGTGVLLKNTLIANNTGGDCATPDSMVSQGHNLVGGTTCNAVFTANATDIKNAGDPRLGPLASNGGPTQTMALLAGSPAIDRGDNVGCPATDQRGAPRPATAANPCDIGAYEFVAAPAPGLPNTGAQAPRPWSPWLLLASTLAVPVLTLTGLRLKRRRATSRR
jgi:hypothetical protein